MTDAKRLFADSENGEMKNYDELFSEVLASAKELIKR